MVGSRVIKPRGVRDGYRFENLIMFGIQVRKVTKLSGFEFQKIDLIFLFEDCKQSNNLKASVFIQKDEYVILFFKLGFLSQKFFGFL